MINQESLSLGQTRSVIRLILIKIKKQLSPEQIADFLELDLNFVKAVCQIAAPMAPDYDLDKIYEKYHAMLSQHAFACIELHPLHSYTCVQDANT